MTAKRLPTGIPARNVVSAYLAMHLPEALLRAALLVDPSITGVFAAFLPGRLARTLLLLAAQYLVILLVSAYAVPRTAWTALLRFRISWRMIGEVFMAYVGYLVASAFYVQLMYRFFSSAPGFERQMDYREFFGTDMPAYAALGITALVIAPVIEELFFRGVVVGGLRGRIGTTGAIFVGALLFAIEHRQPENILPLFLIGLVNGTLYVRHGTLVAPVLFHALNNSLAFLLLLVR